MCSHSAREWTTCAAFRRRNWRVFGTERNETAAEGARQTLGHSAIVTTIEDLPEEGLILTMLAVYMTAKPPGPAARWLIDRLRQCPNNNSRTSLAPAA